MLHVAFFFIQQQIKYMLFSGKVAPTSYKATPSSPHNEHQSSSPFFSFYLELYKNKFKNLIWTSKFKSSFGGLPFCNGKVTLA